MFKIFSGNCGFSLFLTLSFYVSLDIGKLKSQIRRAAFCPFPHFISAAVHSQNPDWHKYALPRTISRRLSCLHKCCHEREGSVTYKYVSFGLDTGFDTCLL
jgi:hypothetical protein